MWCAAVRLIVPLALVAAAVPTARAAHSPVTRITVHLNDQESITVRRTSLEKKENGRTWRGEIESTGEPAMLMRWNDGRFTGMFAYRGQMFTLNGLDRIDGQVHAIAQESRAKSPQHAERSSGADLKDNQLASRRVTAAMRPRDRSNPFGGLALPKSEAQVASHQPNIAPISLEKRRAMAAKKVTIDVMVLYTSKVASKYVDVETDLIAHSIAQANQSFVNSDIGNIRLHLVHSQQIDYDEADGTHFDHLYRMVDGAEVFAKVRALRNEKRADVVVLIVDDGSGCGLATRVAADAEEAFAVVHHACAALTYSVPHEIGHIIGARHDMSLDQSASPFPYGHGYVNGTKWRDIMSYNESCNGCPRLPLWSNPAIKINGEPAGTVLADNARVILEQAERVSMFR